MDLTLSRSDCLSEGIFGALEGQGLSTLEHAYEEAGRFVPKIPSGTFLCVRGKHRLHGMTDDFETFEITGVEGHSKLLFHWGNWNKDSDGCVLLGMQRFQNMMLHSRDAFDRFMALQLGVDSFTLTVLP